MLADRINLIISNSIYLSFGIRLTNKNASTAESRAVVRHFKMTAQKLLISTFILLTFSANAQTKDTTVALKSSTAERTTRIPKSEYPLIIINGEQFEYSDFSNLYFDNSSISSVNVFSSKNDSSKLYGKTGHNGIIIVKTKYNIDWISSTQIFRQHSKSLFHFKRKTIIKVNGSLVDPADKIYIQKDLIKSITVDNDALEFLWDKEYNKVINVILTKKSGVQH